MHCVSVLFCFWILFLWMYVVQKMEVWNLTDFKIFFFVAEFWFQISYLVLVPQFAFLGILFLFFLVMGWLIFFLGFSFGFAIVDETSDYVIEVKSWFMSAMKDNSFCFFGFLSRRIWGGFSLLFFSFFQGGVD